MANEKKPAEPSAFQQQIDKLTRDLADAWKQIHNMQRNGGFADSKMLSARATRIEQRVESLELDGEMLRDGTSLCHELLGEHLRDRHDADLEKEDSPDVLPWRKWRRRIREWNDKRNAGSKRRAVA